LDHSDVLHVPAASVLVGVSALEWRPEDVDHHILVEDADYHYYDYYDYHALGKGVGGEIVVRGLGMMIDLLIPSTAFPRMDYCCCGCCFA